MKYAILQCIVIICKIFAVLELLESFRVLLSNSLLSISIKFETCKRRGKLKSGAGLYEVL